MNHRIFGKTEFNASEIGLGCWQLGGSWAHIQDSTIDSILGAAYDSGINFYDTADVYGAGRSETHIGKFIKGKSDIFVTSKVGRTDALYPDKYTEAAVEQHIDDSLKRLDIEALDLIQLHCLPPAILQQGEIYEWMRNLVAKGKIKHWGASVETMDEALVCMQQPDCKSLQIIFNVFRQKAIETIFDECKEKNIALIIRLPIASGLLAGKITKQTKFEQGDHRNFNKDGQAFNVGETFAGLPFELGVDLADELKQYIPAEMTMAQFALRWILDFEAVSVVIPGASKPAQAIDNAKASDFPQLPPDLHETLKNFYEEKVKSNIRGLY